MKKVMLKVDEDNVTVDTSACHLFDEGGIGLCPKLPEMKLLRCRNCIFCRKSKSIGGSGEYALENGHPIYTCAAMHYGRMRPDGKIPATTPRDCPIKEAKRKNL